MIGAIIGDICGSKYEFFPIKTKKFNFFKNDSFFTDDTVMTLAVARALLDSRDPLKLSLKCIETMRELGRLYPEAGYGGGFKRWLNCLTPKPYGSYGNGAAMRVSPIAYATETLAEALTLSDAVTGITHNHPEGIKGARAVTSAIYLALQSGTKDEIREHIRATYYPLDFTLSGIRGDYHFDVTCMHTVPEAIVCFLESDSLEDAIRNAVSLGGDADTLAAVAGSIAGAYYGVPEDISIKALEYLDNRLNNIVSEFLARYPLAGKKPFIPHNF